MENITAIALNNKTVLLMWQQPENIFKESNFTYNITAVSVTTGALLEHQTITYDPSVSPQERFNFSNVSICEEISFTLIQIGDCREKNTTIFLPICKDIPLLIIQKWDIWNYSSRTISL